MSSPSTKRAIERLTADMGDTHVCLYRKVVEVDLRRIRLREIEAEKEKELEADGGEDSEDNNEGEGEDEDGDIEEDDDTDPVEKIFLDQHPTEYHIYEVWAEKDGDSVSYWIYSADYVMEGEDSVSGYNEEATRAEAIALVEEACSHEDVEDEDEDREISLSWYSRDADGRAVDFPEDDEVLEFLEG